MNEAELKLKKEKILKQLEKDFSKSYESIKKYIFYSSKIETILGNHYNYGEYYFYNKYDTDNNSLIRSLFRASPDLLEKTSSKKGCYYFVHRGAYSIYTVAFSGNEEECINKALISKASRIKDIPHIINGLIYYKEKITKKLIIDVMMKYDRQYGKILLDMYNKNLIFDNSTLP